jgi:hypothetical protein
MFWRIGRASMEFDFTLSAGCTSAARGIDMDPRLHGGLEKILLLIYQNLSFTG